MTRTSPPALPRLQGMLALLALFAVLAIAAAVYHGVRLRNETLGRYRDMAGSLVRVGERELTGTMTLIERTLTGRGEGWASLVADPRGDERLRENIAALPALRSLSVVDGQGRILASSSTGSRGRQLSAIALAALTGPEGLPLQVSRPWTGRDLAEGAPAEAPIDPGSTPYFFTVARQSTRPGSAAPLWLVAAVNPDFFSSFLAAVAENADFAVDLYRYDGVLLTSTQSRMRRPGHVAAGHPVFSEWLPDREIGLIDPDMSEGSPQILAFRASRRYPLLLEVRMPYQAVLKGWHEEVQHLAQGTAVALLFVMLLTWLLYRQQQRREKAESEVRSEIELAARVFDAGYDGILITNAQRQILRVNASFTDMTGYSQDEVVGQSPRLLSSGTHDAQFYKSMWETIDRQGQWQGEVINRRKNGECFPERLAITTVHDAAGQITHYIGTFTDISERKRQESEIRQAQEKAEAANQAKSQFLAVMSHEIRTPMNGILGMAQLLQTPGLSQSEQNEYATTIFHSGQVLLTLLNDILDLSKVEAGKMELTPTPVDPARILQDVVALFADAARSKGLALHVSWQALPHRCYGIDAIRLRQMLANLLNNAIKFTDHGEIRLNVVEVGRLENRASLQFELIDTGIGIAPDRQAELFQAFSQVDSSRTRRFGGTGLGLSILAQLARLMGGTVGVESREGQGSRFWFTLMAEVLTPRQVTPAPLPAPAEAGPSALEEMAGAEVLIVEDNLVNQKVLQAMLKRMGRSSRVVINGLEAVQTIQRGDRPGLVLMDCEMPVMDGYEATRQIRRWEQQQETDQPRPGIPIVALTAGAFQSEREACMAAGMNDFLSKPLEIGVLRAMLAKWSPSAGSRVPGMLAISQDSEYAVQRPAVDPGSCER